jgi:hypothetical protein
MEVFELAQAAGQIKASPRWLADRARAQEIPARKIAGLWVFTRCDLDEILEICRKGPRPADAPPDYRGLTETARRRTS